MEEEVRLGDLKKYVPFMDYIVTLEDYQYRDKFQRMRQWIIDNKKFSKIFFKKIEQSIIVTYKDLGKRENFPEELHKIFTVDLCSDDESEESIADNNLKKSAPVNQISNDNSKSVVPTNQIADNPKIPDSECEVADNISQNSAPIKQIDDNNSGSPAIPTEVCKNNLKNSAPAIKLADNDLKNSNPATQGADNNLKNSAPAKQAADNNLKNSTAAKQDDPRKPSSAYQVAESSSKNSNPALRVADDNSKNPISVEQAVDKNANNQDTAKQVSDTNSKNPASLKQAVDKNANNPKNSDSAKRVADTICTSKNTTETVTISDNENDDLEIVTISISNGFTNTLSTPFNYIESLKRRGNNLSLHIDPNEEILERINATNVYTETPRVYAPDKHVEVYNVAEDNNPMYFRRRKDFNINDRIGHSYNDLINDYVDQRQNKTSKSRSKKKKKKHKKEKRHRREKHKEKQDYTVIDNITIDSSEDDEDTVEDGVQNMQISDLNEPELLKMKSKIIAEMETESEKASNDLPDTGRLKEVDELKQLESMKDNIMKRIGLDQSTTQLLENLILDDLQNTTLDHQAESSCNNQSPQSLPALEITPKNIPSRSIPVIEHSTLNHQSLHSSNAIRNPNLNNYYPSSSIQNQYPPVLSAQFPVNHLNNQFSDSHQYMPNMNTPVQYNNPPLPVPPPINAPSSLRSLLETPMIITTPYQHLSNDFSMQPLPPQPSMMNMHPVMTSAITSSLTQPNSSVNHRLPVPTQTSTQFHSSNTYPVRNVPTQRSSSNLISIPTSTYSSAAPTQSYPSSSNLNLNRPAQQNLQQDQIAAPTHQNSLNNPAITPQTNLTVSRPQLALKDPRLRKILEEGQYGHNRQPSALAAQTQSVTKPSCTPAVTTIHNWIQPTATSDKHGTTKSRTTYGEYLRGTRESDEENARRKQERRMENQQKLKDKHRLELAAKKVEDIEFQKQTEHIKQILNPHKNDIINILQNSVSKPKSSTAGKSQPIQSTTNKSLKGNAVQKTVEPKKNSTQKHRELKELECTVKGFNRMQDYVLTNDGKRRSSLSARKAIASLLSTASDSQSQNPSPNLDASPTAHITKRRRSISVASDTEICSSKLQKRNEIDPKMLPIKRCKVVLHRISQSEILRYKQKRIDAIATTELQKILLETPLPKPSSEAKQKDKMYATKSVSTPIEVKNIDCQMTERNCDKCVLCQKRSTNLTNHFIRIHKKESYLSRLTWEELDDLQINVPFAEEIKSDQNNFTSANKAVKRFKVECPFCPEGRREVVGTFANLRQHYSSHTGEYAYQCKGCGLQKPYRKDILDHQDRTKCLQAGLQTLYQYPSNLMVIYIYTCHICNFVQLNEENVFKHLREQHGKVHRDQKFVKEYTLAAIKDGPIERVRLVTLPEIIPSAVSYMEHAFSDQGDNENVVVGNEPLLDDSFSNIIKPEPMDDEDEFLWDNNRKLPTASTAQATFDTAIRSTLTNNTTACLQTSAVDIKPEIETTEQNIFEGLEAYFAPSPVDESTVLQEPTVILENKPDVEKLTLEAVKALLRKYSAKTGIPPDLLFQCSNSDCRGFFSNFKLWSSHMTTRHNAIITTCPHCISKRVGGAQFELPIAEFEQHFKTHCLRLYLCFHCDIRCVDEQQLRDHAQHAHADIPEVRIELILFNIKYAYHVLLDKNIYPERLEFLMKLCNVLRERVERMEAQAEDSEFVISQWTASKSERWLEELSVPIYVPSASKPKCIFPNCQKTFTNPTSQLQHLQTQHDTHRNYMFLCKLCGIESKSQPLDALIKHNFMHAENIFVCGVCLYSNYDRKELSKHICSDHDKRDVPVLNLKRSKIDVQFQIEFVFAAGSRTFTTTNRCFCGCGAKNLRVDTYVSHLRREHLLKLYYFCEYCDERLPQLKLSDEHFRMKHAETRVASKVRCKLACSNDRQVNVISLQPLEIRLSDENYGSLESDTESPKKAIIPNPVIKNEIDDDEEDTIIIMEEDEIVAEIEAKEACTPKNIGKPGISCTNILNLM